MSPRPPQRCGHLGKGTATSGPPQLQGSWSSPRRPPSAFDRLRVTAATEPPHPQRSGATLSFGVAPAGPSPFRANPSCADPVERARWLHRDLPLPRTPLWKLLTPKTAPHKLSLCPRVPHQSMPWWFPCSIHTKGRWTHSTILHCSLNPKTPIFWDPPSPSTLLNPTILHQKERAPTFEG